MATSSAQISELIAAIHAETMAGRMPWNRSAEGGKFQSRIGNYVIHLSSAIPLSSFSIVDPEYMIISVSKIDGTNVETVGGYANSLMPGRPSLSSQDKMKLRDVFMKISTTNQDIDELIKLIKNK